MTYKNTVLVHRDVENAFTYIRLHFLCDLHPGSNTCVYGALFKALFLMKNPGAEFPHVLEMPGKQNIGIMLRKLTGANRGICTECADRIVTLNDGGNGKMASPMLALDTLYAFLTGTTLPENFWSGENFELQKSQLTANSQSWYHMHEALRMDICNAV